MVTGGELLWTIHSSNTSIADVSVNGSVTFSWISHYRFSSHIDRLQIELGSTWNAH